MPTPEPPDNWPPLQLPQRRQRAEAQHKPGTLFRASTLPLALAMALMLVACQPKATTVTPPVVTRLVQVTVLVPQATLAPSATVQPQDNLTHAAPTAEPAVASNTQGMATPNPSAPLCPDTGAGHNQSQFHTLWDSDRGCHYDHEHGQNPFTAEVAGAFPGFDLQAALGGVQIGHTNPSSPAENTAKHGGFKWQVSTAAPQRCAVGFEGGAVAVDAYAIQYHAFGAQSVEFEARQHSTAALLRQCRASNPADKGYVYVVQLQEYGQRVAPYQGAVLPYPDNFPSEYAGGLGPYFTTDCVGTGLANCRSSLSQIRSRNLNANSIWTSKPTGTGARPPTASLFRLLFRVRDNYQVLDSADLTHPFTWLFVCGGADYQPAGCRWNNTTTTIHEIAGDIPAGWDNLAGWDSDPRPGRVTAEGFVNQHGDPTAVCQAPGTTCYPIRLVGAFVGFYSSELSAAKVSNPTPANTPERDLYFCGDLLCAETSAGAVPSGWVGPEN